MKAVIVEKPGEVVVRDISPPKPGPFEALVKIEACGLCGTTDWHIVEGKQAHHPREKYPAVLGHEAVGTVVEIGSGVKKYQVGDRVTRPVAIWPGTQCEGLYSGWGGFAEFGFVRDTAAAGLPWDYTAARQHVVPPALTLEDAVLAISLSEVASWMRKVTPLKGKTVVIGGTGFAAAVMAQCARAAGAAHIIAAGRNAKKFARMRENGATDAIELNESSAEAVRKIAGAKADWLLDAAGHQDVFEAGLGLLKPGGQVAIYGAPEDFTYRLPLGRVGGDFSVHFFNPTDDLYFDETCQMISNGQLNAETIRSHVWAGLDSIHRALQEQREGLVLKGLIRL
jgi:2-desacetyl-2-hydroxyethyl bacteriochlorophyllide A dehydrogenase